MNLQHCFEKYHFQDSVVEDLKYFYGQQSGSAKFVM